MLKKLKNHPFPRAIIIIETRKDSQWILKPLSERFLNNIIKKFQVLLQRFINYKIK